MRMRPLTDAELLELWERGFGQPPVQRALSLLAAANPEMTSEALAELSIGQRDALLLTLRQFTFGDHLVSLATCPKCGERLELDFSVSDIYLPPAPLPEGEGTLSLEVDGYQVRFRLPTSRDLENLAGGEILDADPQAARNRLLVRCLLAVSLGGEPQEDFSPEKLPQHVVEAIVEKMAQADPQAEVALSLACPACGHQWRSFFDVLSFFWTEINAWAYRTLEEIHLLASAYGWREADILALSPWRRQAYLEMVRG